MEYIPSKEEIKKGILDDLKDVLDSAGIGVENLEKNLISIDEEQKTFTIKLSYAVSDKGLIILK